MSQFCLEQNLPYLIFPTGISLLFRWDFNLPPIPLSVHNFIDGLLELSLPQVSFVCNSLNRQLGLVFVLDSSEVTVSKIDALVVLEDRYHPKLESTICFPRVDTLSPLLIQLKLDAFVNVTIINYSLEAYKLDDIPILLDKF